MNDQTFKTFPSNRNEALALIYVQSQDLSGKTPKEINALYWEAYNEIKKDTKERITELKNQE